MTKDITLEECRKNNLMKTDILKGIIVLLTIVWIITLIMINLNIASDIIDIISAGMMLALWLVCNIYNFLKKI